MNPDLFRKADRIQTVGYITVASAAVVFYDYVLTFPNEVALLRGGRITLPKLLFAISRYSAIAIMSIAMFSLSHSAPQNTSWCRIELLLVNVLTLIFQTCIGVTMGMKTAALWKGHRIVVASIWLAFVGMFLLCYTTFTIVTISLYENIYYLPSMRTCLVDNTPAIAWAIPASQLLYDSLITGFLCYMGFLQYHSLSSLKSVPVLKLIVRNGLIYFLLIDSIKFAMSLIWANLREAPLVYGPLWLDIALTASVNSRSLFSLRESLDPNADRSGTQSQVPLSEAFAVPTLEQASPDDKAVYKIPQHYRPGYDYDYEYGHGYHQENHHGEHFPAAHDAYLLGKPTRSVDYKSSQSRSSQTLSTPYNPSQHYYPNDPYNSHNVHTPRTPRTSRTPRTPQTPHLDPYPYPYPHPDPSHPSAAYPYNLHTTSTRSSASSSLHTAEDQYEDAQRTPYHRYWMSDAQSQAIPLVDLANSPTTRHGGARGSNASAGFGHAGRLSGGSGAGSRPSTGHTVNGADNAALNSPGGEPTNLGGRLSTSTASPTVGLAPVRRQAPNTLFTYESYQQDANHITGSQSHSSTGTHTSARTAAYLDSGVGVAL